MTGKTTHNLHSTTEYSVVRPRQRLHVAFVADCLDGHMGGGMVSARRFVEGLGGWHEVTIIGTGVERPDRVHLPAIYLPGRRRRQMGFAFALPRRRVIRESLAVADVVHLQYPFWLSFVALEEARKLGKPVVAALHVQPENLLYNIGVRSPRVAKRLFRYWVERYYNHADLVVCPSEFAAEKAQEHGLTAPVLIVSNGYSPDVHEEKLEREPQHEGRFLILSLGRFGGEKRQDVLLSALALSRHQDRISVVVGGAGPRERKLRRQAAKLRMPVEVGFLPPERLLRILNTADLFVHASEVELEGMAVLDAMSVGLPALVAQAEQSAASRFALDEQFAFPAGDPQALSEHIDALIENPARLLAARARSRELVRGFQFPSSVGKLASAYSALTGSALPGADAPRLQAVAD